MSFRIVRQTIKVPADKLTVDSSMFFQIPGDIVKILSAQPSQDQSTIELLVVESGPDDCEADSPPGQYIYLWPEGCTAYRVNDKLRTSLRLLSSVIVEDHLYYIIAVDNDIVRAGALWADLLQV